MLKLIALIICASSQFCSSARADELLPAELGRAQSSDCAAVDLRSELDPIRLQGEAQLCFAYSASDLVRQRTGIAASAMDLATEFFFNDAHALGRLRDRELHRYLVKHPDYEEQIESFRASVEIGEGIVKGRIPMFHHLEGGHEVPTLLLANLNGLCEESSFPSANGYQPHAQWISALEKAAFAHSQRPGPEVARFDRRFRDPVADIFNTGWLRYNAKSCRRKKSPVPLIPVWFELAESGKDLDEKVKAGKIGHRQRRRYLEALNFALNQHRIVAVGYDLNAYLDPNAVKVMLRSPRAIEEDGDHSSTVIARRRVGENCQYLIRDTSGYECYEYQPALRARCENHHFWLTESELVAHFYDLVYLR